MIGQWQITVSTELNSIWIIKIFILYIMGNNPHRRLTEQQKKKLETGKPVYLEDGVKITVNKDGEYEGIPEEWVKQFDLPIKINLKKLAKTKHFPQYIRPDSDLPDSIIELINRQQVQLDFSSPSNFKHTMHLEVDMEKPYGIKGLPNQWIEKFNSSKLSADEVKEDPKGMIHMISRYEEDVKQSKIERTLLSTEQFQEMISQVEFIQENPANKFIFDKELGKGAMCKVFYAYDRNQKNRQEYACRIMKVKDQIALKKIRTEIAVMKLCHSKAIVEYYWTFYYKESLFMFVQYMKSGALTDFIYRYQKKIPQEVIAYIIKEVLRGLKSLHVKSQLHRDLKSDNILINPDGQVKIADFGFAIQLTKEKMNRKSVVGTPAWMAPQLIKKEDYDQKVDIWSLGMVTIELCNGQPPYLRMAHLKAMHSIVSKPPPKVMGFSQELQDFVSSCLQKNPGDRSTASALLKHSFIKQKAPKGQQKFIQMIKKMKSQFPF